MDKGCVFSSNFCFTIIQILPCKEAPATRPSGLPHVVQQWGNPVLDPLHLPPV